MSIIRERKIEPSDIPKEVYEVLQKLFEEPQRPRLVGADGESIILPDKINQFFIYIIKSMLRNQIIYLFPQDESFTTQAAANFLGFSRTYLIKILNDGKIPFTYNGSHRRILLKDIIAFQSQRDRERKKALNELTVLLNEEGYYDQCLKTED